MKISTAGIALTLALLLSGCAATWVKVDDASKHYQHEHYRATIPAGWLRLESEDSVILSKDGILLQYISIHFRPHKNAFKEIEKDSSSTMLPSELAELTIAEFKAAQDEGLPSLEIVENVPVEIAGQTGFSIHLQYKTDAGLRRDMLLRGFVDDSGFYVVKYSAPTLHYFERDLHTYESVTKSLRL